MNGFIVFVTIVIVGAAIAVKIADIRVEQRKAARRRRFNAIERSKRMHPSDYRRSFKP